MRQLRRAGTVLLALTLLSVGGAACSDDDDGDDADDTTTTTEAGEAETVEVTAVDYEYEDLPDSIPAGTQLTLTNASAVELHELVAFLVPDGEERSVEEIAALPQAELSELFSAEPATVLLAPPDGAEMIPAVGDGTIDQEGRYVVFCAIPVGADPQEYMDAAETSAGPPQVDGGAPHFTEGMYAEFTVE